MVFNFFNAEKKERKKKNSRDAKMLLHYLMVSLVHFIVITWMETKKQTHRKQQIKT